MKKLNIILETGSISGGVAVVGHIANRLSARGWDVEIWSVRDRKSMGWFDLRKSIKWNSFQAAGTLEDYGPLFDVLKNVEGYKMATYWRTAALALEREAIREGEGLYLVQDVETSYASQKALAEVVMSTYNSHLLKLTTSRWVESQLPDCRYIGIGLDPKVRRVNILRGGNALSILRRQALKGYDTLMEFNRHFLKSGRQLMTFGLDKPPLPCFAPVNHVPFPQFNDVLALYSKAGVFVSTSRHEGFGLPRLEAMACGTPVVSTRDDGGDEYMVDGGNCLVGSTGQELSELALKILDDHTLGEQLSKAGIETAKRYVWQDVIDRFESIVEGSA